jgi:hypothetical protein
MDCTRYETALREHALGEPPSPALEAHLASCEACRARVATEQGLLAAIDATLDGVRQIEPSPTFMARARAAALDASRPSTRFGPFGRLAWNPASAVAAVALAAALGVIVARGPRPSADPIAPSPSSLPGPSAGPSLTAPPAAASLPRAASAADAPRPVRPAEDRLAVLVPPGQEEAIVRLAVLVATGAVAPPASLVNPPDPTQPLTPPAELSLPPLAIELLGPASAENEGVMP